MLKRHIEAGLYSVPDTFHEIRHILFGKSADRNSPVEYHFDHPFFYKWVPLGHQHIRAIYGDRHDRDLAVNGKKKGAAAEGLHLSVPAPRSLRKDQVGVSLLPDRSSCYLDTFAA